MNRLQYVERELAFWNTEKLKITHPLRQLFWECTLNCNLSCLHCGSDCKKEARMSEMPLADFYPYWISSKRINRESKRWFILSVENL